MLLCIIGQRAFGEYKVPELRLKAERIDDLRLEWHFIRTVLENKINSLLALKPSLIHSVDSLKTAQAIQKRLGEAKVRALLQINAANEISKSGVSVESAREVYDEILITCPNLIMEGVMCIGANSPNRTEVEQSFQKTSDIFHSLQDKGAKILSMGMSGDFEIARFGKLCFE